MVSVDPGGGLKGNSLGTLSRVCLCYPGGEVTISLISRGKGGGVKGQKWHAGGTGGVEE